MGNSQWTSIFALAILAAPTMFGAGGITPPNVTVGENLEVIANVALADAAPENGVHHHADQQRSGPGHVFENTDRNWSGIASTQGAGRLSR